MFKSFLFTQNELENKIFLIYLENFEEYIQCKLKYIGNMKTYSEKIIKIILDSNERNKIKHQRLFMKLTRRISKFNEKCNLRKNKISAIDHRQQKFKHFIANKIEDDM